MTHYSFLTRLTKRLYRCLPRDRQPNFFILGAGKSGTTSMYNYLGQHPDIFFPTVKEPAYFAFSEFAGQHYNSEDQLWVEQCVTEPNTYSALYKAVANERTIGDATPIYLYHPYSAEAIYNANPNAKLVAILRDPYERAYSDYRMHHRQKNETRSFYQALTQDHGKYRLYVGSYLEKSLYGEQITRYHQHFNKDQLKIVLYSDFLLNADAVIEDLITFLDASSAHQINTKQHHNVGTRSSPQVPTDAMNYMQPFIEQDLSILEQTTGLNFGCFRRP